MSQPQPGLDLDSLSREEGWKSVRPGSATTGSSVTLLLQPLALKDARRSLSCGLLARHLVQGLRAESESCPYVRLYLGNLCSLLLPLLNTRKSPSPHLRSHPLICSDPVSREPSPSVEPQRVPSVCSSTSTSHSWTLKVKQLRGCVHFYQHSFK